VRVLPVESSVPLTRVDGGFFRLEARAGDATRGARDLLFAAAFFVRGRCLRRGVSAGRSSPCYGLRNNAAKGGANTITPMAEIAFCPRPVLVAAPDLRGVFS
jgi:hypothetical protein